jgi:alanine racemase
MPYPESNLVAQRLLRPSWAEIDLGAIGRNVAKARAVVGPARKIYFVCKGDGFGFGADTVAKAAVAAGVDGLCVGSPEEASKIRQCGVSTDILLFASTLPQEVAAVVDLGVTMTIQSPQMLQALLALQRPVEAFVEVDSGFGRFGLSSKQWSVAFEQLSRQSLVHLRGVYSHLSAPEDPVVTAQQAEVFDDAIQDAEQWGFTDLEHILASSRVMILHPDLNHTGVDPGRFIYGALDQKLMQHAGLDPLLKAVRGRIMHIQHHTAGAVLGLGYGAPLRLEADMRLAIVPIGFWDGFNHAPPLGQVIVHGQFAPAVGRRSFQHTVIDVSAIPKAEIGSVVTLMGHDGDREITGDELARTMQLPLMEVIPRLARSLPHVFVG